MTQPKLFKTLLGCLLSITALSGAYAAEKPPIHHTSAEVCKACHQVIYDQWKTSMHSQSTAINDPIHGTFYRHVIGDPTKEGQTSKKGKYPVCLKCHSPSAALDKSTKLDKLPAYNEGVTCVSCHTLASYQGIHGEGGKTQLGISAYTVSDKLQGPSGKTFSAQFAPPPPPGAPETNAPAYHPFPMDGNPTLLRTSDACLGCHDQRNNANNVPLCMTGAEFRNAGAFNCQQCHMAVTNGIADHSMLGGHSPAMVARGLVLSLDTKRNGDDSLKVAVTIQNMLPHKLPTGAPFRNMFLRLAAFDEAGNKVWQNYENHPMMEDKQAMFMLVLVDDQGKPTAPPTAVGVGGDSRLDSHEKRVLIYEIPVKGVTMVRAVMYYDLLLPPIKKKFAESIPAELRESKEVARAEVVVE